jgi:hypothetical protein
MTFISTLSALGELYELSEIFIVYFKLSCFFLFEVMLPAWLYTLGTTLMNDAQVFIPFPQLLLQILLTVLPCLIGIFASKHMPRFKNFVIEIAKPLALFVVLSFLILTIVVKYYVYMLVEWKYWLIAPFLPFSGYFISAVVAYLFKLPIKQVYTISIETGTI